MGLRFDSGDFDGADPRRFGTSWSELWRPLQVPDTGSCFLRAEQPGDSYLGTVFGAGPRREQQFHLS
jgi:hypothetical protein